MNRRTDPEVLEGLRKVLDGLNQEAEGGALIVVEGRRDAEALRRMGFRGEVHLLQARGGVAKLLEKAGRKVVLLVDWDRKGAQLARRVAGLLEPRGCRVDLGYRLKIAEVTRGHVRHIEDLASFSSLPEFAWRLEDWR